ncbi:MAG TPA: pyridoxal-dependent decarboxylase, exosortase A system-associated [Micromonosporaceae bacterium]|nr:pyridoxal-dependent decarboxylase, exosortase A system-associated [Micromonosporaceae bacterium]HCU51417.1 pyridoxal-dependent decarboxylase, exosortase A system-associated [Micromonosporaceae bacterium]
MTHPTVALFGRSDGALSVGGIHVRRLTERVGSTPYFAYDRGLISRRIQLLRAVLPSEVAISYAVKANPMPAVIQHLAGLVDGFDVASGAELRAALDTGISPQRITFAGPGKTNSELRQGVAAGITHIAESEREAAAVAEAGRQQGVRPTVALRVNPDFKVRRAGSSLGGGPQHFGVDAEDVPAVLHRLTRMHLDIAGLHIFNVSQALQAESLIEVLRRNVDLLLRLAQHVPDPVRFLNIGGGFGIPYFSTDEPLDLVAVAGAIADLVERTIHPNHPEARIVLELGRYLVGECGVYVTRIVDRKQSRGRTFLIVDGGMHHQLAASGGLGQFFRRNFPIVMAERVDEPSASPATVVGALCTPLDVLGEEVPLPDADVGDLIAVFQAGAYGLTASPAGFLSHPLPIEILV